MIEAEMHDGTILEFPDGTDPAVMQRAAKSYIASQQPAAPQTFEGLLSQQKQRISDEGITPNSFGRGLLGMQAADPMEVARNLPGSAMQYGKNLYQAVSNPIDSAKAIGQLGLGVVDKAVGAVAPEWPYSMPDSKNAQLADAVGAHYKDRYGTGEAFSNTVETDPVGTLSDMAGVGSLMGSVARRVPGLASAGSAVAKAGKAVDPINAAVGAGQLAGRVIGKMIPDTLPAAMLETALKIRPSVKASRRAAIVQTALDEGVMPTVRGLKKTQQIMDDLNDEVSAIISSATDRGVKIPSRVLFKNIRDLRNKIGGNNLDSATDLSIANSYIDKFLDHLKSNKKTAYTPDEVQAFKVDAYKHINWDAKQGASSLAVNETRKSFANAAKESLEVVDPAIKNKNARLGKLIEMQEEMERVVKRLDNRNLISLDTAAKIGGGAALDYSGGAPGAGTVAGFGAATLGNPRVKARIALTLHNIQKNAETANALRESSMPPVVVRQLLEKASITHDALMSQLPEDVRQAYENPDEGSVGQ